MWSTINRNVVSNSWCNCKRFTTLTANKALRFCIGRMNPSRIEDHSSLHTNKTGFSSCAHCFVISEVVFRWCLLTFHKITVQANTKSFLTKFFLWNLSLLENLNFEDITKIWRCIVDIFQTGSQYQKCPYTGEVVQVVGGIHLYKISPSYKNSLIGLEMGQFEL